MNKIEQMLSELSKELLIEVFMKQTEFQFVNLLDLEGNILEVKLDDVDARIRKLNSYQAKNQPKTLEGYKKQNKAWNELQIERTKIANRKKAIVREQYPECANDSMWQDEEPFLIE